jgi:two-component system, cell cycle response regulator CtrA
MVAAERKMRVLLIENDQAIASTLRSCFSAQSWRIEAADTGEDALELLRHYQFDMVVLKLSLPDMDGTRVISRMRSIGIATPVLALSSRRSAQHGTHAAFSAGADDVTDEYVDLTELTARMHAIIRRSRGHSQSMLQVGALSLDLERHDVAANGIPVALTGKEFELLRLLMLRRNLVLTKEAILDQLYGGLDEPEVKIVDVFVCKIRKKLARAGLDSVIGTVWGRGYTIQDTSGNGPRHSTPRVPEPAVDPCRLVTA